MTQGAAGVNRRHVRQVSCAVTHSVIALKGKGVARLRIFKNRWFEKFARKQGIADGDLLEAVDRAERGLVDADLGGGVLKQRIAREGGGKCGGYRTIILFRSGERAVFVFGFAKKERANLMAADLETYRRAAKIVLALADSHIDGEVAAGRLTEVKHD